MLKNIRSISILILTIILMAAVACFCYAYPHKVITAKNILVSYYYVFQADKQYSNKDLVGAIRLYQKALKYYPYHSKANYNLANILAVYEDYIGALDYYQYAVLYRPKFMNARIALGILLAEKFYEYDTAIDEYKTAIEKAPFQVYIPLIYQNKEYLKYNKSAAYHNMGLAYKWKSLMYGQTKEESRKSLLNAIDSYKKAIKFKKDSYDSYFNLALTLQLLGDNQEAKKVYCKCINMRPFDYDVHYNLAVLLREEKNYLDAILELEKAALIVDSQSDGFKTRYIYDVLNETSGRLVLQANYEELREKLDKDPLRSYEPTFVNGKIVASEELDKAVLKNMRTCAACKDLDL